MSILGRIVDKIFGRDEKPQVTKEGPAVGGTTTRTQQGTPPAAPASTAPSPAAAAKPTTAPQVDVEKLLSEKAAKRGEELNWGTSIVDLLKLLDLDSSLQARRELAAELGYKGDTQDTATMNVWLIRAVMNQLATHGGQVPASLRD